MCSIYTVACILHCQKFPSIIHLICFILILILFLIYFCTNRKWNVTLQTFTNSPGSLFNEAYDYTSNPEGDSQLCDKIEEAFGSGSCTIEPGIITIYGLTSPHTTTDDGVSPASSSDSNRIYTSLNKLVVSLGLILFFVE